MKILITGTEGYLGSYLYTHLANVDDHWHLGKGGETWDCPFKADYVINCIGKPDVDFCEENPEKSLYSNGTVIKSIHHYQPQAKIINFSSYYVYDHDGKCFEHSPVTEKYNYCRHNLLSEHLVDVLGGVSFRLGKLFGHNDLKQQHKLTEYLLECESVTLDNVMFNPTSLDQVLDAVIYEISKNHLDGVYNLSNSGSVSHYDWGKEVLAIAESKAKVKRVDKLPRSFDNYGRFEMDTSAIEEYIDLRSWKKDLYRYINELWTSKS
jgi:dTDP-4-dehydrorhamnose reductase